MITVNPPVNHSSKLIFLLCLCLLPTLDCFLDFDYERCFMYISKISHTLNIYINKYYRVCTIMKYFYEHIDLKRKVCVILILTIPCCEPTNHMCNNGLFIDFYHYYKSTAYAHNLLLLCILHCTHLYQHAYIYETLNQRLLIVIYCIIQQYVPAYYYSMICATFSLISDQSLFTNCFHISSLIILLFSLLSMIFDHTTCITLSYVGHVNFHSYNLSDSLIVVAHIPITSLVLIPESLIHCIKQQLFIFDKQYKTACKVGIFYHDFITIVGIYDIKMNYIFVYEYSLIILINVMNLTNTNFLHPRLDTCISTLFMYNSHVHSVINGYNISFPTKQTLYFLPSQQFIQYSNLMTFLGLFSIHVFILINSENNSFYSNIVLLKSYIINKLLYYLNVIMVQCYLTIIVLMSYLSYLVPQYSLCTIVRYMKCILLVLTNHRHYFSIISSYTIRIMCSFYYYTSYSIVTVHTFLSPLAFLVFNSTPWFSKPHIDINYWDYPHKLDHVAISTVYYLYLNTKAHKYVHCLIEYSLFILTKRYIIESYENSMFMSLFSPYLLQLYSNVYPST